MADLSVLKVLLHQKPIGTLVLLESDRILFTFDRSYIDNYMRDTLSLSFKDQYGGLITDIRPTQTRVMPFFSNLLPEGPMRDYLAQRAGVNPKREFFLLWALGQDLPGAITIQATDGDALPPIDNGDDSHRGANQGRPLRFSLAGVQLKFSAVMAATGGLTIPVNGVGGSWIVKLPSSKYERVPENEYAMMTLARRIGIDVPEIRLISVNAINGLPEGMSDIGTMAFAIRRFDRLDDGSAVHIEDFAQVFDIYPDNKYKKASYKNIAKVLRAESGEAQIEEFIRRLVFNTLIGNADMHLKNWSLIYPDRRTPVLSPAYDYVSTIVYLKDENMALKYVRTSKFSEISKDELKYLAAKALLPQKLVVDTAADTVDRFFQIWKQEKFHLELPRQFVDTIDKHLSHIPIFNS
ncbi:MAG: type II toxin-antitoxin system HipA family toxin [Rhodospirillales bacterium]|nr:type II toxin-antitoxin system HipA family toxin [Rhodospirillales bacterium]